MKIDYSLEELEDLVALKLTKKCRMDASYLELTQRLAKKRIESEVNPFLDRLSREILVGSSSDGTSFILGSFKGSSQGRYVWYLGMEFHPEVKADFRIGGNVLVSIHNPRESNRNPLDLFLMLTEMLVSYTGPAPVERIDELEDFLKDIGKALKVAPEVMNSIVSAVRMNISHLMHKRESRSLVNKLVSAEIASRKKPRAS